MSNEEKFDCLSILSEKTIRQGTLQGTIRCQVLSIKESTSKNGSVFLDIEVADQSGNKRIKIWPESQAYSAFLSLPQNAFIELSAIFRYTPFGLQAYAHALRTLNLEEIEGLLNTKGNIQVEKDWEFLHAKIATLKDPRLRVLCQQFLLLYGEKLRRAAAAREYHHNFRGGLLRHVCQMIEAADALMLAYPSYNWDLVKAGILFHDCGKLWENDFQEKGFAMKRNKSAELIGHIPLGVEVVNSLWRSLQKNEEFLNNSIPPTEEVRIHLLHLIIAHHGLKEHGSPITPRTPEAWIIHVLDNLDAKLEMFRCAYAEGKEISPGIFERKPPLEGNPVAPLDKYSSFSTPPEQSNPFLDAYDLPKKASEKPSEG
ncbi:HD domain-containing protein [Candidatus Methylacidiphilum infernorum]|uniref:HD-superfamily hydrolase n=1 Tax=Methylacidiphilum infernorum (isolate V4) TaxID=481448 RepID=B3DVV1_METI4|nr:HD domain-containing protein [Candidatus Methylacidiphilum infernorum]ACD83454.1 HD-superfamily hydrolase [Methylacidiphilum infernorum V4]